MYCSPSTSHHAFATPQDAFLRWRAFSRKVDPFPTPMLIQGATETDLPDAVLDAYEAPFPEESYKVTSIGGVLV